VQVTDERAGLGAIMLKEALMRGVSFSVVVCLFLSSSSAFGAIVYSGSMSATLSLSPMEPMTPMSMTIDIAESSSDWDDFEIVLVPQMVGTMGSSTRLLIYAPGSMAMGMGTSMGGIVGLRDLASNLAPGAEIGPSSSLTDDGQALLTGSGEFGADGGYIGLMMDNPLGSQYYGWLHMLGQSGIGEIDQSVTFDGWAYETEAGKAISAGDVGVIPVPGAVCLGLLGIGMLALARSRRGSRA
jgi:hypothetical protein